MHGLATITSNQLTYKNRTLSLCMYEPFRKIHLSKIYFLVS